MYLLYTKRNKFKTKFDIYTYIVSLVLKFFINSHISLIILLVFDINKPPKHSYIMYYNDIFGGMKIYTTY